MRPHLDYGDVIFDQACNKSFHKSLEFLQYNASLAITGAIRRASNEVLQRGTSNSLPRTRFKISSAQALVSQTVHFLQDF